MFDRFQGKPRLLRNKLLTRPQNQDELVPWRIEGENWPRKNGKTGNKTGLRRNFS